MKQISKLKHTAPHRDDPNPFGTINKCFIWYMQHSWQLSLRYRQVFHEMLTNALLFKWLGIAGENQPMALSTDLNSALVLFYSSSRVFSFKFAFWYFDILVAMCAKTQHYNLGNAHLIPFRWSGIWRTEIFKWPAAAILCMLLSLF